MSETSPCILITGGNGGLGLAIARSFLTRDKTSYIYLGVRSNRDHADEIEREFSGRCGVVSLDVTCAADWENALNSIESNGRTVTILVNNAGHHDDHLLAMMPFGAWESVIATNLTGTFIGSQAVIRCMIKQRFGRIINIASLSAIMAPMGQTNYAAAKAGMVAMTQSLAKEVARMGITVNAICPGYVDTQALQHMDQDRKDSIKSTIPMRRFGRPDEVACAVFFLASKEAGYITGSSLKIDGGIF